jgi:signal transduction histidine kinase
MSSLARPVRWYSSFYWRIGISFVVFVGVVLVGQSLMVGYARSNGALAPGNPNAAAAAIAADLDTLDMPEMILDEDERRRYVDTARRETIRLERIVADLLELARFENGVAEIAPRVVAVERVFAGIARRFERDAGAANVTIRACVDPSADQIFADADRLDQALSNLVANALRRTHREVRSISRRRRSSKKRSRTTSTAGLSLGGCSSA